MSSSFRAVSPIIPSLDHPPRRAPKAHSRPRIGEEVRSISVEGTVIEAVSEQEDAIVVTVRPNSRAKRRCPRWDRRCRSYDRGDGPRRWRALDLGSTRVYLEAESPRVQCPEHGVITAAVPWARQRSRFTRHFEDQTAWLATQCSKTAVQLLMRTSWMSVGRIITRVVAEAGLPNLTRLRPNGINEFAYRRGQRYLTLVVDHDTGTVPSDCTRQRLSSPWRCSASKASARHCLVESERHGNVRRQVFMGVTT
jgi:transposase